MFELYGAIQGVSADYQTGKTLLTLSINQGQSALDCFDELHLEEKLSIKIDKYRQKRSLNANAYCWKLLPSSTFFCLRFDMKVNIVVVPVRIVRAVNNISTVITLLPS